MRICKEKVGLRGCWEKEEGMWVGCQAPSFPRAVSCSPQGTSGLLVSALTELSVKQIP